MVASNNKQKSDALREEDISKVLEEDKCDILSEESDDSSFDTGEEDSDSELDTGSIVCESEWDEEASDLTQPFVCHGVEHPRFAFVGVSGLIVKFDDKTSVLACFQKFVNEEMWQLFAEQINIYTDQFFAAHPDLKP